MELAKFWGMFLFVALEALPAYPIKTNQL